MNILILGTDEILNLFTLLKHFQNNINHVTNFDSKFYWEQYHLIITDSFHLTIIDEQYEGIIFNVVTSTDNLSTRDNVVNLLMNFNFDYKTACDDLINQFIKNKRWNFYYRTCHKAKVKFIYDLFSQCEEYNKIHSKEVKFYKI